MDRSHLHSRWLVAGCLIAAACGPLIGQDDDAGKRRLKLMDEAIRGFEVNSESIRSKPALAFAAKPLLRYSDPTRGLTDDNTLLDATVWRLGEKGRPTALVTLELYRSSEEKGALAYEFLSLSDAKLSLAHQGEKKVAWDATGTELELKPLEKAPMPAKTAAARLSQMRQLVRRFTVREKLKDEFIECRLLTQPIDRYESADDKIVDGAIFVFANATNPETGILLECSAEGWEYGVLRLSSAEAKIELDEREVASYPFFGEYGRRDGPYTSTSHPVALP